MSKLDQLYEDVSDSDWWIVKPTHDGSNLRYKVYLTKNFILMLKKAKLVKGAEDFDENKFVDSYDQFTVCVYLHDGKVTYHDSISRIISFYRSEVDNLKVFLNHERLKAIETIKSLDNNHNLKLDL